MKISFGRTCRETEIIESRVREEVRAEMGESLWEGTVEQSQLLRLRLTCCMSFSLVPVSAVGA